MKKIALIAGGIWGAIASIISFAAGTSQDILIYILVPPVILLRGLFSAYNLPIIATMGITLAANIIFWAVIIWIISFFVLK